MEQEVTNDKLKNLAEYTIQSIYNSLEVENEASYIIEQILKAEREQYLSLKNEVKPIYSQTMLERFRKLRYFISDKIQGFSVEIPYELMDYVQISGEEQEKPPKTGNDGSAALPEELNTEEAITLLQKAVKIGLCDDSYKWLKSKALLAYFADKASEYLGLGKGEYDGRKKVSWKPFETLFVLEKLSLAKQDYQKTGTLPSGYMDVDRLFNN